MEITIIQADQLPSSHEAFVQRRNALVSRHPKYRALGGSDMATIMGIGYMSRNTFIKQYIRPYPTTLGPSVFVSGPMRDGIKYEKCAGLLWDKMRIDDNDILCHDISRPWEVDSYPVVVSVDGLLPHSKRVFEVKCMSSFRSRSMIEEQWPVEYPYGIPPQYYGQLELYCRAHRAKSAVIMFLLPNESETHRDVFDDMVECPMYYHREMTRKTAERLCIVREYPSNDHVWKFVRAALRMTMRYCGESELTLPTRKMAFTRKDLNDILIACMKKDLMQLNGIVLKNKKRVVERVEVVVEENNDAQ